MPYRPLGLLALRLSKYAATRPQLYRLHLEKTDSKRRLKADSRKLRFLVQEHRARRLHWDFRLELNGVLKSWAVPKGPPTETGVKRLAVEVEDHPLSYFGFEGTIPKGEYGAGEVKVWDDGFYDLELREPHKYHVFLKGRKLKGDYRLINFKDKNWLIYRVE